MRTVEHKQRCMYLRRPPPGTYHVTELHTRGESGEHRVAYLVFKQRALRGYQQLALATTDVELISPKWPVTDTRIIGRDLFNGWLDYAERLPEFYV